MTDTPDNAPLRTEAGDSPTDSAVPIWVTACVRLHAPAGGAADKAITAAQILLADRIRVYGRDRAVTTQEELAEFLGYARRDKVKWVVDYLERIGFLAVPERREAEVDKYGRRKPRRDEKNRTVGDTFLVHERAPAGYIGPRTLHELREALKQRRQWSFDELFIDPSSETTPTACTSEQVQGNDRLYPRTGTGSVSPGQPCTQDEVVSFKEGSFASFQGKEGSEASLRKRDAAPLREADGVAPEVWAMAAAAPWAAKGHAIRDDELAELVPVIVQAMTTRGLTLDHAQAHLDQAIARLTARSARKRLDFVIRAFTDYAPAVAHPDQRPLPDLTETSSSAASGTTKSSSEQHLSTVGVEERSAAAWCGDCRPVRGNDGRPACRSSCTNHVNAA